MTSFHPGPDWQNRMPGEQWVLLDSVPAAEAYLSDLKSANPDYRISREAFPNAERLYARIGFPDRIQQNRVYVQSPSD